MASDIKNAWLMENIMAMNGSKTKVMKFRQGRACKVVVKKINIVTWFIYRD
jgi:hypothetical protein